MIGKWILCAWLFVGATPGLAQAVAGAATARLVTVTEGRQANRFKVPQVQLADAAVAGRINRRIVELVLSGETNPKLTVRQQLRQAERTCCYDAEGDRGWNTVGQGLTECGFDVLLNQQGLLSLEYLQEFTGAYSWERTLHVTFDLRTGRQLALTDLVADPPAQLTRRMHSAISRRFGEFLTDMSKEADSIEIDHVAELFCWNWKANRVRFQSDADADETGSSEPDLESFALTPRELRLYYGPDLPHVMLNYEPDDTYRFPFARIQPRGLLVPLAKAAAAKKAKGK